LIKNESVREISRRVFDLDPDKHVQVEGMEISEHKIVTQKRKSR